MRFGLRISKNIFGCGKSDLGTHRWRLGFRSNSVEYRRIPVVKVRYIFVVLMCAKNPHSAHSAHSSSQNRKRLRSRRRWHSHRDSKSERAHHDPPRERQAIYLDGKRLSLIRRWGKDCGHRTCAVRSIRCPTQSPLGLFQALTSAILFCWRDVADYQTVCREQSLQAFVPTCQPHC